MLTALRNTGLMLLLPAGMAALTAVLAAAFGEWRVAGACGATAALAGLMGGGAYLACRHAQRTTIQTAFATAALCWAAFSIVAALPLFVAAQFDAAPEEFRRFDNSLFEGTSAATSTGLTVARDTAALPLALQFWRSLCQWVGGLGVLVLALSLSESVRQDGLLFRAVARQQTLEDDVGRTAGAIWKVHATLTAAVIVGFGLAGMPWWEALNHGLVTVSTGGFTMNGTGAGAYSRTIQAIMIAGMLAGAVSFLSHYRGLFRFQPRAWFATPQHWTFYLMALVGSGGAIWLATDSAAFDAVFLWVSAFTTCGLATVEVADVGGNFLILLIGAMFVGGMAGSTVGGVKLARLLALASYLVRMFRLLFARSGAGDIADLEDAMERRVRLSFRFRFALLVVGLWIVSAAAGSLGLAVLCRDFGGTPLAYVFEAVSALGCVGLTSGLVSPDLAVTPKLLLCALMWAGRIEIIPVLMLLALLLPVDLQQRLAREDEGPGDLAAST